MLQEFIADVLEIQTESIKEIVITNPELVPEASDGKFSRLDLNLRQHRTKIVRKIRSQIFR